MNPFSSVCLSVFSFPSHQMRREKKKRGGGNETRLVVVIFEKHLTNPILIHPYMTRHFVRLWPFHVCRKPKSSEHVWCVCEYVRKRERESGGGRERNIPEKSALQPSCTGSLVQGGQDPLDSFLFVGHFPQKSPVISGPFAEMTCNFRYTMDLRDPVVAS